MWNILIPAAAVAFILSKKKKTPDPAVATAEAQGASATASTNDFPIVDMNDRRPEYDFLYNDEAQRSRDINLGPY